MTLEQRPPLIASFHKNGQNEQVSCQYGRALWCEFHILSFQPGARVQLHRMPTELSGACLSLYPDLAPIGPKRTEDIVLLGRCS